MPSDCITYQNSGYFSKLIVDYLDEKSHLKTFYNHFPNIENFKKQIEEKKKNFNENFNDNDNFNGNNKREILVTELEKQYLNCDCSEKTLLNIQLLKDANTFTITTGHQLNLFTGPLYFLYKIVSTINLCKQLKSEYSNYNFVPIYWMATEDHDFDEINYFRFKNKKIQWNSESSGAVGRKSTEGLDKIFELFSKEIGTSIHADYLKNIFENAYLKHANLADATRFLANELFKNEGLVILDGDSKELKKLFIPYVKKELLEQISFKNVSETNAKLNDYAIQVNPREINLFYLEDNLRERIVFENSTYKVLNTNYSFSEREILNKLEQHPEKFSPNVILRPLYQEVILPNLCYIGGGGELAYWLQLKSNFDANEVTFPMLLLRNSVVVATEKQAAKMNKLGLNWADLFLKTSHLVTQKTKELSILDLDFSEQKAHLKKQFEALYEMATQTDKSFLGAVKAQEIKQIKGLENLEKRLLKAEKRNLNDKLSRIEVLQNELFPNGSLQERQLNFSEFYLEFGQEFIDQLLATLKPLEQDFTTIII